MPPLTISLAALGAILLLPLSAPAQMPRLPGAPQEAPASADASAAKGDARLKPEEIRKRLAEAEAELARIQAPGGLAAGAPPGVPEGELLTRRLLLQQLVRTYQGQRSEATSAAIAERRRADVEARIKGWKGFDEKPPYSMLLVDRLRENLQKESLRIEAQEARLRVLDGRIEAAREMLDRFQGDLRRAQENLEGTRREAGVASLATWRQDLAALGVRTAGASLVHLELSRESAAKDLDATRLEFAFAETQLKEAETQVRFTREDLDAVQARIKARREALQKELELALTERDTVERGLEQSAAALKGAREARDKASAELAAAREELRAASARADAAQSEDKSVLETLNPVERIAARRASDARKAAAERVAALEREAAARAAAVEPLERADELQAVKARNAVIQVEMIGHLTVSNDLQSAFWDARFRGASDAGAGAADLRKAHQSSQELLAKLAPLSDYVRQQLHLTIAQIAQQQSAARDTANPADAEHARALLELLAARERSFLRSLGEIEELRRLLERWLAEFRAQTRERGTTVRTRHWIATAGDMARSAWNFELFAVQDTIEVDGQRITGSRGITVGKVTAAILIVVVGFFLLRLAVRLIGRIAERRWEANPNEVRLLGKWLVALGMAILVLTSLEMVKIPLTVFAFLGGAIAIGLGFGMQNLLKNLISGVMVISERSFRLGDTVEVGGIRGEVTDLNLRACTIRDVNGIETLVPNSTLIEQNVTNWTYTSRTVRFTVRVGVAYGSPVRQVAELLKGAAERHGLVLEAPPPEVLFEDFGADALVFALSYWLELKPGVVSREVASDLRFMIEKSFAEHGIVMAFPQRDVHLDSAAPLQVQVVPGPGPAPTQGT